MSIVTVRPSVTNEESGLTKVPSATAGHAILADDSDATYITSISSGDELDFDFALPTGLPSTAFVKSVALRARMNRTGSSSRTITFELVVYKGSTHTTYSAKPAVNNASIATSTVLSAVLAAGTTVGQITRFRSEVENGSASDIRVYEEYLDLVYVAAPSVTVSPFVPSTIIDNNLPPVEWSTTLDPDGGPQSHYEVKIFSSVQYSAGGFAPGSSTSTQESGQVPSSDTSWTPPAALPNGTYRAYVRVATTINNTQLWSQWATADFTINLGRPGIPTLATTAEAAKARIKLLVNATSGVATTTNLEVQRSTDLVAWTPVRLPGITNGVQAGVTLTAYDYEAPNNQAVFYRARALHDFGGGLYAASDWVTTSRSWTIAGIWWLKCPERPSLNYNPNIFSLPSIQRPARMTVFQPLGRGEAVVVQDKRGARRGTLKLWLENSSEKDLLDDLLDSGATLLLQGPPEHHFPNMYVRFGDSERARIADKSWIDTDVETLAWFEVQAPVGAVLDAGWPA